MKRTATRRPEGTIAIVRLTIPINGKTEMYFVANGKARMPWMKIDADPRSLTMQQIREQWRYTGVDSGTMRQWKPRIITPAGK